MNSWSSSVVDSGAAEQTVRGPRSTDAVASALRDGYAVRYGLPIDMARLVASLDRITTSPLAGHD